MKKPLLASILFGAIPLVAGVGIFVTWLISRWDWLMAAGAITIFWGLISIFIGMICLGFYVFSSWKAHAGKRWVLAVKAGCVVVLYITNLVTPAFIMPSVSRIISEYMVTIDNQSSMTLVAPKIHGGGVSVQLEDIPSGKIASQVFRIKREGELRLYASLGSQKVDTIIDGYVTTGMVVKTTVIIREDGSVHTQTKHEDY